MKKYWSFSAIIGGILVCLIALFYSCDNNETTVQDSDKVLKDINIGIAHNAGLDLMLSRLQSLPKTRAGKIDVTKRELIELTLEITKETVNSQYIEPDYKNEIYEYLDQMIADKTFDIDVETMYRAIELTPTQESYARELDAIFVDDDDNLTSLKNRIYAIESKAKKALSGQDLESILAACSVASYTLEYWHDNAPYWIELSPLPITRASFSWKNLGRADLNGAVGAAFGGFGMTLLSCGPVGWKGWAACVIGGALGTSAMNAVDQLWPE